MSWSLPAKALVVLSSLTLGCTYVAYRQKQSEPPLAPASDKKTASPKPKNPDRVTVLPGSKSIDAVLRKPAGSGSDSIAPVEPASEKAMDDEARREVLLQSSKSGRIFEPPSDPASKTDEAEEKKRALLPSSKIGPILSPEDAPATNRKELNQTQEPPEEDGTKK